MKNNIKNKILIAVLAACSTSAFAGVASFGFDSPDGQSVNGEPVGRVLVDGTLVGSCSAPVVNLDLGSIDFHTAKNGSTGVYERMVDINVSCTNPNQVWAIATYTGSFDFSSGVNGQSDETGYVSLSSSITAPGTKFNDPQALAAGQASIMAQYQAGTITLAEAQNQYALLQSNLSRETFFDYNIGNSSIQAKLTFGKNLPNNAIANITFDGSGPTGGVPSGTIDGRGAFSVDVPLVIYY